MKVNQVFYSLQGEGKWTGLPNVFIRVTGCNLRCSYCDTKYAYEHGKKMSVEDIVNKIKKFSCKHICITGGEPLLQDETYDLLDIILKKDYMVCLETNGSISIKNIVGKKSLMISLDIKCPSSGMNKKMEFNNLPYLTNHDQLKFVIGTREDYEYATAIIKKYSPVATVFFQPVWGTNPRELSSWILEDGLNVRLGLQLQKIVWGDKSKV